MKIKSREQHEKYGEKKLKEIKGKLKLFALDYDGTLFSHTDPRFNHDTAVRQILRIVKTHHTAVVTARAASIAKIIIPILKTYLPIKSGHRLFFGLGNGGTLSELKKNRLQEIYNNGLSVIEVKHIINIYKKIVQKLNITKKDLNFQGIKTYTNFLCQNWKGYIPDKIFNLCKPFSGTIFTEEAKVSIVSPINLRIKRSFIKELRNQLSSTFKIRAGDIDIHVTKKLRKDGKVLAVETLLQKLKINPAQLVTFGDLPEGNDAGLLSFPFSFTNNVLFMRKKESLLKPPFIIPICSSSQIECIHKAINFLLS